MSTRRVSGAAGTARGRRADRDRPPWWRRLTADRTKALLSLGLVAGVGTVGTLASWSDTATATSTFSTGTVKIRLTTNDLTTYAFSSLNLTNMGPGASSAATLPVRNIGTLPFGYTITGAGTDTTGTGLAAALLVTITTGTVAGSGSSATCSGTALTGANGVPASSVNVPSRTLAAAGSETLCVQVTLPSGASTTLQGTAASTTFTFTATNG